MTGAPRRSAGSCRGRRPLPGSPVRTRRGTRAFTGWLEVAPDGGAVYAPHTSKGFTAPPRENLLLVTNGLFAKAGRWRARRNGAAARLERLGARQAEASAR